MENNQDTKSQTIASVLKVKESKELAELIEEEVLVEDPETTKAKAALKDNQIK